MVGTVLTYDEVLRILQENEYTNVTFYKLNGELRDMVCTLNPTQLELLSKDPEFKVGGVVEVPSEERDYVNVFDLEKKDWRSFIISNVVTIEGVNT